MPFYAGFDSSGYPGALMDWLRSNTNLVWCGYYLAPAPNHPTSTWMGTFAAISGEWGLLPIYVGQQDARTARKNYTPSSILTTAQGALDGKAACDLVSGEGFPPGSFVYLDWEYGGLDGRGSAGYIKAWISAVVADGRARPGVYCSYVVAPRIAGTIDSINPTPATRLFCWQVETAVLHPFTGDITTLPELDPAGCGFTGAQVWQREQRAMVDFPAGAPVASLEMDFSTSTLANPGAPIAAFFGTRALPTDLIAWHPPETGTRRNVSKASGATARSPLPRPAVRRKDRPNK